MNAMTANSTFAEFISRIRAGDEQAAEELVRRYEPVIRLEVRMRITDSRLYRIVDSLDICQSVLASFFVRTALGQYDLDRPEQLMRLLVAITRNKAAMQVRRQRAARRDHRRGAMLQVDDAIAATDASPSRVLSGRELLQEARRRMSEEELRLVDLRAEGRPWAEIAAEVGGTAHGRRKQMARAAERVARELGLEEVNVA
jgi:DNA-directed RNA polymerase specialized sigma24 family protein